MKRFLIFIAIFLLTRCGLPDASSLQALQIPSLVVDSNYPKCTQNGSSLEITLELWVYNSEIDFTGYNVYITTNAASGNQVQTDLTSQVLTHISSSSLVNIWNTTTEQNFIITNPNQGYPTIRTQDLIPFPTYSTQPTLIQYTINSLPPLVGGTFSQNAQYGIGVTSVSIPSIKESLLSNVIIVNTGTPTVTGGKCGIIYQMLPSTRLHH